MFTWLNKQGVESDEGFVVQVASRSRIEYREGGRKITIPISEGFVGPRPAVYIGREVFAHWDGDPARLASAEQTRLLENFKRAMDFQGVAVLLT